MPDTARPASVEFLGLPLAVVDTGGFVDWIVARARKGERTGPALVGYLNAAQVNLAFENAAFRTRIGGFDCLYADGQSIVWAARFLGRPVPERVNAGDFTRDFFTRSVEAGLRIALVGGPPGVAEGFARHWSARVPGLEFVFVHPGYFGPDEENAIRGSLDETRPDLVMLGLGAPLQERAAAEWSAQSPPRVWWCVGALFEYDSGMRPRAPVWMRRAGLEWVFRLALEPRRLARRYLVGNPRFVLRVLLACIRGS